jgi:hypothetical protein
VPYFQLEAARDKLYVDVGKLADRNAWNWQFCLFHVSKMEAQFLKLTSSLKEIKKKNLFYHKTPMSTNLTPMVLTYRVLGRPRARERLQPKCSGEPPKCWSFRTEGLFLSYRVVVSKEISYCTRFWTPFSVSFPCSLFSARKVFLPSCAVATLGWLDDAHKH